MTFSPHLRIAMFCRMPPNLYSGGRYHALIMMEALAQAGHDTYLIANNKPMFYKEFEHLPHHRDLKFVQTPTFGSNLPKGRFDIVVLVPDSGAKYEEFFLRAEHFALNRKAHLVLLNFESGNWYNSLSPVKRDLKMWAPWQEVCQSASMVLSISKEGNRWARDFYRMTPKGVFDYCYPSINTDAADAVTSANPENSMLLFTRFSSGEHKGGYQLPGLFCEAMREWTLTIVMGTGEMPIELREELGAVAKKYGVQVKLKYRLTDAEKFAEVRNSKLVLFPSYFEGYGYPPVESLYCNVPCLAFDLPVLRETCGDAIIYAKHGDWSDFREKLARFITDSPVHVNLQDSVRAIATLEAHEQRLCEVFLPFATKSPRGSLKRFLRQAILKYRLVVGSSPKDLPNFVLKTLFGPFFRIFKKLVNSLLHTNSASSRVIYYPRFTDSAELTNHYFRACWYLPFTSSRCEAVEFFSGAIELGLRPEHMGVSPSDTSHIRIQKSNLRFIVALFQADTILLWKEGKRDLLLRFAQWFCGNKVINVATTDMATREYGVYCSLIWNHLTTPRTRELILQENRDRFVQIINELRKSSYSDVCVFGTGPSLERSNSFDFSKTLNIVCNSIVQSDEFMRVIRPKFICAGDVVSHLGVSAYATQFRKDLLKALDEYDCFFVTTASFGHLLLLHYPQYESRVILINQTINEPNYNLLVHFGAPRLDSTLNIHMLPIAAVIAKNIWMLGCDGRVETRSNEDFWAHAVGAQYLDLVQSGHLCHPTFDLHRQTDTYNRFLKSTLTTVLLGESNHGIRYRTLYPSNIPVLRSRSAKAAVVNAQKPITIEELSRQEPEIPPQSIMDYRRPQNNSSELSTHLEVIECSIDKDDVLFIRGYALAGKEIDCIEIYDAVSLLGSANLKLPNLEVFQEYPEYHEERSGFQFFHKAKMHAGEKVFLRALSGGNLWKEVVALITVSD